ncbi:thioredoxin family protein [Persicobacter psychrovividus]|uniref:Thioredoxin domain-containing protein n=1 Tax=Persicobacter psychrovividus TaxID=387638 RepID=A0ABN6L6Y4_9BACT|nr:hypothetical protein PEPS_11590 [Persicobacter psychrovividus]
MMKKPLILALICLLISTASFAGRGQDKEIKWISFEDAMKMVEKNPSKHIMIDFYTSWCGYCKKLDKTTFKDKDVVQAVNKDFYAVKIDAESTERITYKGESLTYAELAKKFKVPGYPTILLLKPEKDATSVEPGYKNAKQFTRMLERFE